MRRFIFFISILILLTAVSYSQTRIDFWLTMPDNVRLDCTKFIPQGNPPAGGWPCIIICHGFGLSKEDEMDWAESLAGDEDYFSLVYSMRGQGESEGTSNLISTTEMNDLLQVIQYVKNDQNTNDSRVGIAGGSQGGIIPFMAACHGVNVRCLITDLAAPDFASNWIENGCVKMSLLWSVSYTSDVVHYNSTVGRFRSWILSGSRDKWDSLAHYMPINRDFQTLVGSSTVPMLISCAWQDKFFNTEGMINAAQLLTVPFRTYYGSMDGHGSDPSQQEFNYQSNIASDWMDYWLKNIQNGVLDPQNKYTYASTTFPRVYNWWSFQRFASPTWPPSGTSSYKLYFWPDLSLRLEPYTGSTASVSFLNDVRDPNLSMETCVNYEFTGNTFQSKFVKTITNFTTPQLLQDSRLVGIPKVNLYYSSDGDLPQYNFQIYEVQPNGSEKLVTRINWTDRYYTTNTTKQKLINGWAHSHIFKQGNKIRVKVTNLDNDVYDDEFLRTNPYVLPSLKRATDKIFVNGSSKSYLELPMIGFAIGVKNISSQVPNGFNLYQNFPNPFNPSTKIRFDVSGSQSSNLSYVIIKVYNVLGKEVKTLVNQSFPTGTYETEFDASGLQSGVYFCRITAGDPSGKGLNFTDTKTMVLVK
jgi:predicted acyl esterase